MPGAHDFASGNEGNDTFILRHTAEGFPTVADFDGERDQIELHMNENMARDAQLSLRQDSDGTILLEVNGNVVGRLLNPAGLRVEDIRIVGIRG